MRTLPRTGNPAEVRQWAQAMFAAVMNVGIHAHAAFPRGPEFPGQAQQAPPPEPGGSGDTEDGDAEDQAA